MKIAGKACGNTISRIPMLSEMPRLLNASHCPWETELIPPRTTSEIEAPVNILKPINKAENSTLISMPSRLMPLFEIIIIGFNIFKGVSDRFKNATKYQKRS